MKVKLDDVFYKILDFRAVFLSVSLKYEANITFRNL